MPSGGAASGEMSGAVGRAGAAIASDLVAAAVSAFRSMRPESSRVAAPLGMAAGAIGRDEGRLAADVSALSENSTDDSLRAPVPPLLPLDPEEPRPRLPPRAAASGALVATSSSLPAASIPPNKSGAGAARAAVRAAARAGLAAADAQGAAPGAAPPGLRTE